MLLERIARVLAPIRGVEAVVLGGSISSGTADVESDIDIGLYYGEDIDFQTVEQSLRELAGIPDPGEKVIYLPGEWGPWVNGGAWLVLDEEPVDIIFRDTSRVQQVVQDCIEGRIFVDYQTGHPFGFVNAIYAAEVHHCRILWEDKEQKITHLKKLLHEENVLPPKMKQALIHRFLFEADFSSLSARKSAFKGDINYAMGAFFRTVCSWNQVLFALNEDYLMNEKNSTKAANRLPVVPEAYLVRVNQIYRYFAHNNAGLAYMEIERLQNEIMALADSGARS